MDKNCYPKERKLSLVNTIIILLSIVVTSTIYIIFTGKVFKGNIIFNAVIGSVFITILVLTLMEKLNLADLLKRISIFFLILSSTGLLLLEKFLRFNITTIKIDSIQVVIDTLIICTIFFIFDIFIYDKILRKRFKTYQKVKEENTYLKRSQQIYKTIVEDQSELVCRFFPDGQINYVNQAFCKFFGLNKEELINKYNFKNFIPKEDVLEFEEHLAVITSEKQLEPREHRFVLPNGRIRWQRCLDKAIYSNNNELIEYQILSEDITEQKLLENFIRQSEEKFRTMFEESPIGILLFDRGGQVVNINKTAVDIIGINDVEEFKLIFNLFGNNFLSEEHKDHINDGKKIITEIKLSIDELKKGNEYNFTKSGDIYLFTSIVPLYQHHQTGVKKAKKRPLIGYLMYSIDITARKNAEEKIKRLNEVLEQKVEERTSELQRVNKELKQSNALLISNEKLINYELKLARKIQQHFISTPLPKTKVYDFYVLYKPMEEVGGDFYDFIEVDDDHIGVLIADVSGHGIPAALITSMMKISCMFEMKHASNPALFLNKLNNVLVKNISNNFVTAFYGVLSLSDHSFTYANAGHNNPLIYRKNENTIIEIKSSGGFLGVFEKDEVYQSNTIILEKGDKLLLYTDGLTESVYNDNKYGKKILFDLFFQNINNNLKKLIHKIYNKFEVLKRNSKNKLENDDVTIIGMERKLEN